MSACVLPPPSAQTQQSGLLADQFRVVANVVNVTKAEDRASDIKAWRQMLQQFVPVVIRECRQAAQEGVYQCTVSLSALLMATQWAEVFPEQSTLCWHCQGARPALSSSVRPVLRGCFFSTQPDNVLEAPRNLTFDVTDFVNVVSGVITCEMTLHGFSVKAKHKRFTTACPHLMLFTPTKQAPDELTISWQRPEEQQVPRSPAGPAAGAPITVEVSPPASAQHLVERSRHSCSTSSSGSSTPPASRGGNIVMECGICHEDHAMKAILPCGHLICGPCWAGVSSEERCPFCRGHASIVQPLFAP